MKIHPSEETITAGLFPVSAINYFQEALELLDQPEFSKAFMSQVSIHLIRTFSHFYTHHHYDRLTQMAKKRFNNAFKCIVSFVDVNGITPEEDIKHISDWYRSILARTTKDDIELFMKLTKPYVFN